MSYRSLRDFIAKLEATGELVRVREPVSTVLEMTEIQTRLLAKEGPAVIFEKPIKADGSQSDIPVLVNLFGTVKRVARGVTMGGVERTTAASLREVGELLAQLRQPEPPRSFGEALLAPSVIYVEFVSQCQQAGIKLNYVAHVTGHGWRKLMRLDEPFVYEITNPRPAPALFQFLEQAGPIDRREMYATFNQGIGFAAYVAPEVAEAVLAVAKATGYDAWLAGHVKKSGNRKAVVVPSLSITFEGDTLQVR